MAEQPCEACGGTGVEPPQTPQQKLNSLYAQLGLNLRDNDPTSREMQEAAMAAVRSLRTLRRGW